MKIYPKSQDNRVAEVDFLRGIAIICMVVFHWYYLLDIKTGSSTTSTVLIGGMGQIARVLFIFLVGVSVALSKQKSVEKKEDKEKYLRRQGKRVLYLFGYGFLVILVTMYFYPDRYVRFGILQYMGFALLLLSLFSYNMKPGSCMWALPLLLGLVMYMVYVSMRDKVSGNVFEQFLLGARPDYKTMDIFPVCRYFWLSSLGLLVGSLLFKGGKGKYGSLGLENNVLSGSIVWLGKYSLEIYLFHFVVIYVLQMKIR